MKYAVCTGDSYHGSCKFSVLAVFIRKSCSIKDTPDLLIFFSVVTPLKPCFSAFNIKSEIDWFILYRNSGIQKFRFLAIFQMNDRQGTLSQCFTVILAEINIIHIIIIQDQACTVLMHFRSKLHFCCNTCINTGKLSCQNAYFVKRGSGFLSAKTYIAFSRLYIRKTLRHDPSYSGKSYAQAGTNVLSVIGANMDNVFTLEGGMKAWTGATEA